MGDSELTNKETSFGMSEDPNNTKPFEVYGIF